MIKNVIIIWGVIMKKILKQKHIKQEDIIMEPDEKLRVKSEELTLPLKKEEQQLLRIMFNHVVNSQNQEYATKYKIRPAVGIAAIQLGVPKKMIAISTTDEEGKRYKYMLVNPEYLEKSDQIAYLSNGEGCLSVEENKYSGIIPRHQKIKVKAFNLLTNKEEILEFSDYLAIVVQHEMDHLEGKLYIDHINKLKPDLINEKWKEI